MFLITAREEEAEQLLRVGMTKPLGRPGKKVRCLQLTCSRKQAHVFIRGGRTFGQTSKSFGIERFWDKRLLIKPAAAFRTVLSARWNSVQHQIWGQEPPIDSKPSPPFEPRLRLPNQSPNMTGTIQSMGALHIAADQCRRTFGTCRWVRAPSRIRFPSRQHTVARSEIRTRNVQA